MRFVPLTLLLFLTLPVAFAAGDKSVYPAQKVSASGIHEIQVSGVKGRLVLKGNSAKSYTIKVSHSKNKRFEDWSLSVDRQGEALVLEVFNVAMGPQWRHLVRAELWPEFDIEIEGPSVPALISWREGDLYIKAWKSDVEAAFLYGNFTATGMRGDLKLQAVDAQINIATHAGALNLKGEKGRVELAGINGAVDLNWVHGVLRGERIKGAMNFEMPGGNAQLKNLSGKVKANGGTSEWDLQANAPSDLEVTTDSGPVKIRWGGGAKMFLTSSTGAIQVPKPFAVEMREGLKVVEASTAKRGRKNGAGQVFVRTQSGRISWQ